MIIRVSFVDSTSKKNSKNVWDFKPTYSNFWTIFTEIDHCAQ